MKYVYKDDDLDKLKRLELMILEEVVRICEKHNIDYYIYGGTALGAVRHGGFIPWDDDIDILLFRKDYEMLLKIMDDELDSKFHVIAFEKQEDCFFPFAKVCLSNTRFEDWWAKQVSFDEGIFIDVFPLDKVPNNKIGRLIFYYRCRLMDHIVMNSILHVDAGSKLMNIAHKVIYSVLNTIPISRGYWKKLFYNSLTKYENTDSEYVTCYFSQISGAIFGKNDFYLESDFLPPEKIKFEHLIVSVPRNNDSVLRKSYNNYMELPPEDKRVNHSPEVLDFGEY